MTDTFEMRNKAKDLREQAKQLEDEANRIEAEVAKIAEADRLIQHANAKLVILRKFQEDTEDWIEEEASLAKNLRGAISRQERIIDTGKVRKSRPKKMKPRKQTVRYEDKDYRCPTYLDLASLIKDKLKISMDDGKIQGWFGKHPDATHQDCFDFFRLSPHYEVH